jgi:ElaB/YqjD/DUF883 family membrane-anchored ribosome-binding protein
VAGAAGCALEPKAAAAASRSRRSPDEDTMTLDHDYTSAPSATDAPAANRLKEAAAEVKEHAGVLLDQATTKAKEIIRKSKDVAGQRSAQARTSIAERPYVAVGLIFLAGLVVGHALSSQRPQVVYLRDRTGLH